MGERARNGKKRGVMEGGEGAMRSRGAEVRDDEQEMMGMPCTCTTKGPHGEEPSLTTHASRRSGRGCQYSRPNNALDANGRVREDKLDEPRLGCERYGVSLRKREGGCKVQTAAIRECQPPPPTEGTHASIMPPLVRGWPEIASEGGRRRRQAPALSRADCLVASQRQALPFEFLCPPPTVMAVVALPPTSRSAAPSPVCRPRQIRWAAPPRTLMHAQFRSRRRRPLRA
jgi:hypothetical protein